jgi:hypothetical protein
VAHARAANPVWRPYWMLACGLASLFLLNLAVCLAAGVWGDFWTAYVVANSLYPKMRSAVGVLAFIESIFTLPELRWIVATLLGALALYAIQTLRAPRGAGNGEPAVRWFGLTVFATIFAAGVAVNAPHRQFSHYYLMFIVPFTLATAWPLIHYFQPVRLSPARSRTGPAALPLLLTFAILTVGGQILQARNPHTFPYADLSAHVATPIGPTVAGLTTPEGEISVWGWDARTYLSSGRTPATRDTNMANFFSGWKTIDDYYRARYLFDMRRHPADLFVDGAGTSMYLTPFQDRSKTGFALFPEIRSYILANYLYVASIYGDRLYIRRDLASSVAGIAARRACDSQALRCFVPGEDTVLPVELAAVPMPPHALLEARFTPEADQPPSAVVFAGGDSAAGAYRFQLQFAGNDEYRLAIGTGTDWRYSPTLKFPQKKPVDFSAEFTSRSVKIMLGGQPAGEVSLPAPMAQSTSGITLGSAADGKQAFVGNIQFFQIREVVATR